MTWKLIDKLRPMSKAQDLGGITREWKLQSVNELTGSTCLCGKHPITEVCCLINKVTGNFADVGNCCVKLFNPTEWEISNAVLNLYKGKTATAPLSLVNRAFSDRVISLKECQFLESIGRKRKLSDKQKSWKESITVKIVAAYMKLQGACS